MAEVVEEISIDTKEIHKVSSSSSRIHGAGDSFEWGVNQH